MLGRSKHASSNATCLWQRILWADGELTSTSDIYGVFGDRTHSATVAWQKDENNRSSGYAGLLTDGGVGPQSFGWAYSMHLWKQAAARLPVRP
ncbi:hypothetical protein ABZ958_37990 [Streptomyces sp. NPDC046237]|uniref:peptidoglycan-binding domain-containing protein n=1 Tax=Streptomyces sp. NPDC046237 TaxID=3154914 RepID=UPI0034002D62